MSVAVDVLGPVRLRVDGEERSVGRRERLLLALLASTPGGTSVTTGWSMSSGVTTPHPAS